MSSRLVRIGRVATRYARLASSGSPSGTRVFYGHDVLPGSGEPARGGTAKFQRLATRFPNHPNDFNLLYLGSSWLPRDLSPLLWMARRRGAPVVLNQNGVAYPAWAGTRTDEINRPLRHALEAADQVLYQSEFCKSSADAWLGPARRAWSVLPNAVDTDFFTPAATPPADGPVLLLGGDQTQGYRVEVALRTLALVRREHRDARLLISGRLVEAPDVLLDELHLRSAVEFVGRYAQTEAPALLRRAHLLLHTQMNDSCPSLVLEAMGCGLPVVYAASGGTVELVGPEAGIGVPHHADWERLDPPSPEEMCAAVSAALADRDRMSVAARSRAEAVFALSPWLRRHEELFRALDRRERPD